MLRIGFSRSAKKIKIFSDLIIFWQSLKFPDSKKMSHAYGRFVGSSWDRDFIYQASGHASNFMGGQLFQTLHTVIEEYEIKACRETEIRIGQACVDREGKPYAMKQTLGIAITAIVWIVSFGHLDINNPFVDGDAENNCLEEWARILAAEFNVPLPERVEQITPWEFRCWLAQQHFTIQVV